MYVCMYVCMYIYIYIYIYIDIIIINGSKISVHRFIASTTLFRMIEG